MPRTKHTVTDSRGQVHKRASQDRVYSHAIVTHYAAIPAREHFPAWEARSKCEWASRLDLAQKVAATNRSRTYCEGVEIIPAVVSP